MKIAPAIYSAIANDATITQYLGTYNGTPSIHTRTPVPENATYPMIVSAGNVAVGNEDFLVTEFPTVTRDIIVYALQVGDYRNVERCADAVKAKFHRKRFSLTIQDYEVLDIVASGPAIGPVDDVSHVSRIVNLTIRLRKNLA
jgi:hypothetical protein